MEQIGEYALAIGFLNAQSTFDDPVSAARWWGASVGASDALLLDPDSPKPRFDGALAAELRALRAAALEVVGPGSDTPPGSAVAVLSAALARASLRLKGAPPALLFRASDASGAVLFPLARAVVALLAASGNRLRRCANQACAAYFWDATKNGSRRWCRLGCMERARAPRRRLQR